MECCTSEAMLGKRCAIRAALFLAMFKFKWKEVKQQES